MTAVEQIAPAPAPSEAKATKHDRHTLVGRIGGWQLVRKLCDGHQTRIYLARPADADVSQPAAYVVKVLRNEWWRDPGAIARQRREAWVGARVSHPNVVPMLSSGVDGPPFHLVMPLLAGRSLYEIMEDGNRMPVPTALWIVRQIAEGLAAVNDKAGMIHADVKPANIIVAPAGHATLIDFGFAHSPGESSWCADESLVGTLCYMAPERLTSALAVDLRSDIYSLGVTLYQLFTGRLPFESDDPFELAALHRQVKPEPLVDLRPDIPESVATLVQQMLAKETVRRPGAYHELIEQLIRLEIDCFEMR